MLLVWSKDGATDGFDRTKGVSYCHNKLLLRITYVFQNKYLHWMNNIKIPENQQLLV